MKQVEITTRVLETLNSITQKLAKQGFQIIRKSRVEDEYLTQYQGDFEQKHILEMLSSSVLLRYLDVNGKITKKITYKQKTYQNEIVMTEEKINVNCDDLDMAKKLFLALHFRPLVKVCYDVIVFSNQKIELAFQNAALHDFIRSVIVPEMQIKLKQGFGRAIRTETDTCVVAILDERCSARGRYRQDVLDALPEMPILTEVSDIRQFLYTVKPRSYFEAAA